jgi:hypothetical protein
MRVWTTDFASHDDTESDFMKVLFLELRARGIALVAPGPVGIDAEGRAVTTTRAAAPATTT